MTRIRHYGDRLGDGVRAATTRAERLPGVAPGRRGVQAIAASPLRSPLINGPIGLGIVVLILALSGPGSATSFTLMTILVYAIAALGLNIPGGFGGALSLGQGAAFTIGAYTVGALTVSHGWPFWATVPCAALMGLAFGILLGAPAGRFGDLGLALVSLGAVLVTGDMILALSKVTGGPDGLSPIAVVTNFGGQPVTSAWVLPAIIAAVTLLAYLLHYLVRASIIGRAAIATRDEPIGAMTVGISNYGIKVTAFAIGSAFGAVAGGLFAIMEQYISPDAFGPQISVILLAMIVLGGSGTLVGPIVGAAILVWLPQELASYPHVNNFVYGGILILTMLLRPEGLIRRSSVRVRDVLATTSDDMIQPQASAAPGPAPGRASGEVTRLEASGISRSFGGLKALDDVSLSVTGGEVLALIGPNGSGKTTAINVITGMYRADSGSIVLDGEELTRHRPRQIAEGGVARTFQTPKTFPGLSVAEHLDLAKRLQRPSAIGALRNPDPWVRRLLALGGIDPDDNAKMNRLTRDLGHGQLRFLEIAMAIRHAPRILLLDEPAAGLSHVEMAGLEDVTRELAGIGVGVMIVEHHLDLVNRLADRVTVLDLGRVIWDGTPAGLLQSESVKTAYLGGSV